MNVMLNWGRQIMDGIPYADVEASSKLPFDGWFDFWAGRGEHYATLGATAAEGGHLRTAGEFTWLGSLCYQYAQYLWVHEPEKRVYGQRRKVELYEAAAPNLAPPAVRVHVPIDETEIPGYLRLPAEAADGPVPCVVLLGGLESTKEESYAFENELLARGIATYAFDGPGQGELWASVKLAPDFERYTSAVVDALVERPELDGERMAVVGRSLGGHYALKSASAEPRFVACVSWGGFYDMSDFDARWTVSQEAYATVTGATDVAIAKQIVQKSLDCDPVIEGLRCPTYHLHGALDPITMSQVERLRERAVNAPLTIVVEHEGDHCCHNLGPRIRWEMIDWLCAQMGVTG